MNQVSIPSIRFSSMNKQQWFQMAKLWNDIVCRLCSLSTFKTLNSNSYMCCENHVYIIRSISYWECCFIWILLSNHLDNFSFLFWRCSTSNDHFHFSTYVYKFKLKIISRSNFIKRFTWNNDCMLFLFEHEMISLSNLNLLQNIKCRISINDILVNVIW